MLFIYNIEWLEYQLKVSRDLDSLLYSMDVLIKLYYTFMIYLLFQDPVVENYHKMGFWISNLAR